MTKVSRSLYQKTAEENKRLLKDIKILCSGYGHSHNQDMLYDETLTKWNEFFRKQKNFKNLLHEAIKQHMDDKPKDPIVKMVRSQAFKDKMNSHGKV